MHGTPSKTSFAHTIRSGLAATIWSVSVTCLSMHCFYVLLGLARTVYLYTPYMTVYLVVFLPKIPYIHRICMVLANSMYYAWHSHLKHHLHVPFAQVWRQKAGACARPVRACTVYGAPRRNEAAVHGGGWKSKLLGLEVTLIVKKKILKMRSK